MSNGSCRPKLPANCGPKKWRRTFGRPTTASAQWRATCCESVKLWSQMKVACGNLVEESGTLVRKRKKEWEAPIFPAKKKLWKTLLLETEPCVVVCERRRRSRSVRPEKWTRIWNSCSYVAIFVSKQAIGLESKMEVKKKPPAADGKVERERQSQKEKMKRGEARQQGLSEPSIGKRKKRKCGCEGLPEMTSLCGRIKRSVVVWLLWTCTHAETSCG